MSENNREKKEYLDVVDENGNPTGEICDRAKAHALGIMHRTSHVWIVRKNETGFMILLQKRCAGKDSFPGCYDISSAGHIPAGCDFEESALRELKEELGVDADSGQLIFCGDRAAVCDDCFRGVPYHDRQYSRVFLLFCDKEESEFLLQEEEIECVKWIELEECIKAVADNSMMHCIASEELEMVRKCLNDCKKTQKS